MNMSGLNVVVQRAGPRVGACRLPRGTASRSPVPRLQRHVSQRRTSPTHGAHLSRQTPLTTTPTSASLCSSARISSRFLPSNTAPPRYSTWKGFISTSSTLLSDDIQFLAKLVQSTDSWAPGTTPHDSIGSAHIQAAAISDLVTAERHSPVPVHSVVHSSVPTGNLHRLFQGALKAMQAQNSRELLVCLNNIAQMPESELVESIASLPRTTFSELLRCLDPYQIGRDNDPTHGVPIEPGTWQFLNLGAVLDEWGIRVLYTKLLRQMLTLMRALNTSGQALNINDYTPLLRAAGLTSDMAVAKLLWEQMRNHDIAYWRTSNTYHEFIKSRFLTDPAYSGYDKKRLMMTPRNLHRRGHMHLKASISRLDNLRRNLRRGMFKFGLNKDVAHAEDLSRVLRKRLPSTRIFFYTQMRGVRMSEMFLCTVMVAFARAGSLRFIQYRILEDYFGITVEKDRKDGKIRVCRSGLTKRSTKDPFRPAKPFVTPTAKLIDTIVYTYCSNGQLSMAFNIIDFISNTYNIPISQRVWFELLEWSYILSTPPTSKAWHMAGLSDRVPSRNSIEIIWDTMTSPLYGLQPGFKEYDIYIRTLLALQKIEEATKHMREARRFYDEQCAYFETAALEYASVRNTSADFTLELRAFQRARFLKSYMWHRMQGWCNTLLEKKLRPKGLHEAMATRGVPDFVMEWRDTLPNPVRYRTASGYVCLLDPAEPVETSVFVRNHTVECPVRRKEKWVLVPLVQGQFRLLSKHDVGDLMSTRKHPLDILRGIRSKGYPSQSKRVHRYRAWKAAQEQALAPVAESGEVSGAQAEESTELDPDIWDDDDF